MYIKFKLKKQTNERTNKQTKMQTNKHKNKKKTNKTKQNKTLLKLFYGCLCIGLWVVKWLREKGAICIVLKVKLFKLKFPLEI